jgi:hypothetical protein
MAVTFEFVEARRSEVYDTLKSKLVEAIDKKLCAFEFEESNKDGKHNFKIVIKRSDLLKLVSIAEENSVAHTPFRDDVLELVCKEYMEAGWRRAAYTRYSTEEFTIVLCA